MREEIFTTRWTDVHLNIMDMANSMRKLAEWGATRRLVVSTKSFKSQKSVHNMTFKLPLREKIKVQLVQNDGFSFQPDLDVNAPCGWFTANYP